VYGIGTTGAITEVSGSPFSETSGNSPQSAWIDPSGKFVYVVDATDGPGTISVFSLSAAGALTEITGSPYPAGGFSYAITGTADGKYVYVNNRDLNQISAFSINSTTGALTALSTPAFSAGACWLSTDVTGGVMFSTDCSGNVYSFTINADGSLTTATGSPFADSSETWPVMGDPSGKFVYTGDDESPGKVFAYTYTSAGVLTAISGSPFAADNDIEGIVITH
jgi:DNA-binding beta-propeller fold protein YncE